MIDPSLRVLCSCLPSGKLFLVEDSLAETVEPPNSTLKRTTMCSLAFSQCSIFVRAAPISMWGRTQTEGRAMAWSGNRKQRIKRKVLVTNASCIGSHSFERTCAAGCEFFLLLSFCPSLHRPTWLSRRAINARDFTTPSVNGVPDGSFPLRHPRMLGPVSRREPRR